MSICSMILSSTGIPRYQSAILRWVVTIITVVLAFSFGYIRGQVQASKQTPNKTMKRVTGIGGIFFKCEDPVKVKEWYRQHLGLNTNQYGTTFEWRLADDSSKKGYTQWSPFKKNTEYFQPSPREFMINYRVDNLEALVEELKKEGVTILDEMQVFDYGKFIHILDLEGNKIELWEP